MFKNEVLRPFHAFVGRQRELNDLIERLRDDGCRLVTVTGLGGSGKTRIAIEVAHRLSAEFPQGAAVVALQPLASSNLIVSAIAQALGVTFYGDADTDNQLFHHLHDKSQLLVLDNFEHLLEGADLVSVLLAHAPALKILVTSREALNLAEEWRYPLHGLSTPLSVYTPSLEEYDAVQLFLYHARRIQPTFDLTREHDAVVRIGELTAGYPLAIELASTWLAGLSATQIARELQGNLDFLKTRAHHMEARHRSMRAVFDQSWKLLTDAERVLFARLSVFRGGFDAEAAAQVAAVSLASVVGLVEKSLLQLESSGRLRIHELLRQYGAEKLAEYGETETTHVAHSRYYAEWLQAYEAPFQTNAQFDALDAIERDFENVRLAWQWAVEHSETALLHTMVHGVYLFGFLRSRYRDTIALLQDALDAPLADTYLRGRLLTRRWGYLHWWYQPEYQDAVGGLQEALVVAQAEPQPFEVALTQLMLGYGCISGQQFTEALTYLEASRVGFESLAEPYYVSWVLHRIGYVYCDLNRNDLTITYTEQSLVLARQAHNVNAIVICLYNLGSLYLMNGEYRKARVFCNEALEVAITARHDGQIAHALSLVALCAVCESDFDTARRYATRSQALIEAINLLTFQTYSLAALIMLACVDAAYDEAIRLEEIALRYRSNVMGYQCLYWALGILACCLGRREEAHRYLRQGLAITDLPTESSITFWYTPLAAYILADTHPQQATLLLAWSLTYADVALDFMRPLAFMPALQRQLEATVSIGDFQAWWAQGQGLPVASVQAILTAEFLPTVETIAPALLISPLTTREQEVLGLLAMGRTNEQIAQTLIIGAGTVKTHTLNIYRKLEVANRTEAIARARELGVLPA